MNDSDSNKYNKTFDKVLFIGPSLSSKGGIASVLRSYSSFIHPFHFLPVNSAGGKLSKLAALASTMFRLPFARLKGRKIAHIHYVGANNSWTRETRIAAWCRFWGMKTIMHMHCHAVDFLKHREALGQKEDTRRKLGNATANIVLSHKWVDFLHDELGLNNLRVIYNVIQINNVKHLGRVEGAPIQFVFIGDIVERKGVFDLIEATEELDNGNWKLTICGRGDNKRLEERISKSGCKDKIEFAGVINSSQRDKLLSETDVVVLPSYTEGLPIVILEAMAAGTGIIVSDVGAATDIVTDGKNGIVINPGDVQALSSAMKRYINNPELAVEHAAVSTERINAFYPGAVRRSLLDLYTDILN